MLLVLLTVLRRTTKSLAHLHSKINEKAQISLSSAELNSNGFDDSVKLIPNCHTFGRPINALRNSPLPLKIPISHEFAYSLAPHFVTTELNI